MMFVNKQDRITENKILSYVSKRAGIFENIIFKQEINQLAEFDFIGYIRACEVEVKLRHIGSKDFSTLFISREKAQKALKNDCDYYIVYGFTVDRIIRIYHINECDLSKKTITYTHKRSLKRMVKDVYEIPSESFKYEFKI